MRKPVIGDSDQGRHKPSCTTTEDGLRLAILDLGSRGLYYLCRENKGVDQLGVYRAADLRLCFYICKKACFLMTRLICLVGFSVKSFLIRPYLLRSH